jgi:superfamily I DNA/RNA helicase
MDAVELARQAAALLHGNAVSAGADPWRPLEFAFAEARRRNIDVESAALKAAILNGSQATFIPTERLIVHEHRESEFECAFLIAHEIGHIELGDDFSEESATSIDPARSAEVSPIGLDRVIGYGSRQRREVQMDLFAREFLLPREVVRRLHIGDGLTATEVANRLGAPFEVVAQQFLDALLLPPIEPDGAREEHAQMPLNRKQEIAAAHRGNPFLLSAGPGTGKTRTLVARVEGLLREGIDPRRILVLTYSNKAAGEMSERLARKEPAAAAAMWIGTFHAFGLDIVRRFKSELGFRTDPKMMDRAEAVELLEHEFPRLNLVHYRNIYDPTDIIADMLSAISRAKDEVVDEREYAQLAEAMRRSASNADELAAAERAIEVSRVYEAYEHLKRSANSLDFGDLVSLPVRLLESNPRVLALLQQQYDHILVDEYQDVNRSSVRLLKALSKTGRNLWVVGDPKQSIYRFRGASSFNIDRFGVQDFPGGERGQLDINYRSSKEIVDAFSQFAVEMETGGGDAALHSHRGPNGFVPEVQTVNQADAMSVALADSIAAMHAAGYKYREQAMLCRGNEKLADLAADLERLGVPVLFLGSLFERLEIRDLIALLSILTDRRAMGLVRVASWPGIGLEMPDVAAVLDHLAQVDTSPATWLADSASISGVSPDGVSSLARLAAILEGFGQEAPPWTTLAVVLLDRTRLAAELANSDKAAARTRGIAIWQFMNFLKMQPIGAGLPIVRLMDRIRRLVRLSDERDLRQLPAAAQGIDAVRLMTMHGAKGLEFPVVHLPGMNADSMPGSPQLQSCPPPVGMVEGAEGPALTIHQLEHFQEQECVFYVALSRAQDRLFLYAPTQKRNCATRKLSPYVERLGSASERRHLTPQRQLPSSPGAANVPLSFDGRVCFSGPQLALYESCPRRFFYTHVLKIGGRRTSTPFMQMHEVARSAFTSMIEDAEIAVDDEALARRVDREMSEHGLVNHAHARHFREMALAMVKFFARARYGHEPLPTATLSISVGQSAVVVRPDDVLVRPDGRRTLRRIQTGHRRSAQADDVAAAAFIVASRQAFPGAVVELLHLADESILALEMTDRVINNRTEKLRELLSKITSGEFPAEESSRRCPSCPAFFICGPTPPGVLRTISSKHGT